MKSWGLFVLACAFEASSARAEPKARSGIALKSPPEELTYVGETEMHGVQGSDGLAELVAERVAEGLRASHDSAVVTLYELKHLSSGVAPSMQYLNEWMRVPVDAAFRKLFVGSPPPLTSYVSPRLIQIDGALELQLRSLRIDKKWPEAVKVVHAPKDSVAILLAGAYAAAREIGGRDHPPVAQINGSAKLATIGVPFVLDASSSSDVDWDAFEFEWTSGDPEVPVTNGGAKLTFVPTEKKTYKFQLTLRQLQPLTPQSVVSKTLQFEVEAAGEPQVSVGESAPVLMADPDGIEGSTVTPKGRTTHLHFEGSCKYCDHVAWVQTKGPVVDVPPQCNVDSPCEDQPVPCDLYVPDAGEYEFNLVGTNRLKPVRAAQTLLVMPKPVALITGPATVIVHHASELSGEPSYDPLGTPLIYRWELMPHALRKRAKLDRKKSTGGEQPPPNATLSTPSMEKTDFIPSVPGTYSVKLCVTSSHEFEGRRFSRTACQPKEIKVEDPTWLLFGLGGGDLAVRSANNSLGFRLKLGLTIRWPFQHFGLRVAQTLLRSTQNQGAGKTSVDFGGGISVGVAWIPSNAVQLHASMFASTWGTEVFAPEVGGDFRVQRFLVFSGSARYQKLDQNWYPVLAGLIGFGYDL